MVTVASQQHAPNRLAVSLPTLGWGEPREGWLGLVSPDGELVRLGSSVLPVH